jgi:glycosyltransferase involved in cell wall biosynthesis
MVDFKRILFIGNFPNNVDGPLTGPERPTLCLIRGIRDTGGYKINILIPTRFRAVFSKINIISKEKTTIIYAHVKDIFKLLRKIRPQIIHVSGISYFGMLAVIFSCLYFRNIRTVYFAHGILAEELKYGESFSLLDRICEFVLIKYSTVVVTASVMSHAHVMRHYNCSPDKIQVIPHGLDTHFMKKMASDTKQFRKRYDIMDQHIILFTGRLVPLKGLDVLVKACIKVSFLDYKLLVIGNKSRYWDSLVYEFPNFFRKNVIRLDTMGSEDLAIAYSACSIFVLPSFYEPFGLVALEAMALKKPVIVSDRVGMGYLIEQNINGFVIPYGDVTALSAKLTYLLRGDDHRLKIGEKAQETALATSMSHHIERFSELYKRLIFDSKGIHKIYDQWH